VAEATRWSSVLVVRQASRLRAWTIPDGQRIPGEVTGVDRLLGSTSVRKGRQVFPVDVDSLAPAGELRLEDEPSVRLLEGTLAQLGPIVAFSGPSEGGVFGRNGYALVEPRFSALPPGPRFASSETLYVGSITHVSHADFGQVYAVQQSSRAILYHAWTTSPCE
jgi:hypothetical protein